MIWTRKAVLARLGSDWSAPWLGLFARGVKLDETAAYPSPDMLMDAWRETGDLLHGVLENCPEDVLAKLATPPSPPTADGKISGLVRFLSWHETYHVGQIAYVRCLLGHKSLMG